MYGKTVAPLTTSTRALGIKRPVRPSPFTVLSREVGSVFWLTMCFWSLSKITPLAKTVFDERFTTLPLGWQLWIYVNELGWLICVAGIIANTIAVMGKIISRMEPYRARVRNHSLSW
jgi:hypothetical protein